MLLLFGKLNLTEKVLSWSAIISVTKRAHFELTLISKHANIHNESQITIFHLANQLGFFNSKK